jgi:hypothetical protein
MLRSPSPAVPGALGPATRDRLSAMNGCPRCQAELSTSDVGDGVLRCIGCGSFVCRPEARQKLCRFLRVDEGIWTGLLATGGRGPSCPLCATGMRVINLKGVTVDGCGACGALLLDPGELMRLTGRAEGPPPVPAVTLATHTLAATAPSPAAVTSSSSSSEQPIEVLHDVGRVHVPPQVALAHFFDRAPWVQVRQERPPHTMGGAFVVDTGTRYAVSTPAGSGMLHRDEGPMALLARMFLGSLVKQRFVLKDTRDNPMLVLDRRFEKLVLSRLDVALDVGGDPGRHLGTVERNLRVIDTRYELKDPRGQVWARLVRPFTSLWQFHLETPDGQRSGAVAKQWSGFATEFFSDADDFGVDFGPWPWTLDQRAVIVAAALSIDLDHFERSRQAVRTTSLFDVLD